MQKINTCKFVNNGLCFPSIIPSVIANFFFFQPPIGFSIATSIRVGNELGAGNPNAAKKASYLAVICVCKYTMLRL